MILALIIIVVGSLLGVRFSADAALVAVMVGLLADTVRANGERARAEAAGRMKLALRQMGLDPAKGPGSL